MEATSIKPGDVENPTLTERQLPPSLPDTLTQVSPAARRLALPQSLKWLSWAALAFGSVGWLVALHVPIRIWQSMAALLSWQFEGVIERSTPLDRLGSPHPLFSFAALSLWLLGAAGVLWLRRPIAVSNPDTFKKEAALNSTFNSKLLRRGLAGSGLAGAALLGYLVRSSQLLPDSAGRLPASNYDEMVYFSDALLIAQGNLPYQDFLLVHPPGGIGLYAGLLKLGGVSGYDAFWLARIGMLSLGLLTVLAAFWVGGRLWSLTPARLAVLPGLAAAWLYTADAQVGGIATLEIAANFFAVLSLGLALEAERHSSRRGQSLLWLASGSLAAVSTLCKLPGVALVFALVIYLLVRGQWRNLTWLLSGIAATGLLVLGPLALAVGPGKLMRQVILFQLLRPPEVREGADQIGRLADQPHSVLTIGLAGVGLVFLAIRLIRGELKDSRWLLPVLWSLPLLLIFALAKSFHPWYYVQWALPLALLGAGLFSVGQPERAVIANKRPLVLKWGITGLLLVLLAGPLGLSQWQVAQNPAFDKVYRPTAQAINPPGAVLHFDPGYSLLAGVAPARLPSTGQYLVDSAGQMVYFNLDMDRGSLLTRFFGSQEQPPRGQERLVFRRERAQALVVEAMAGTNWAVVDDKLGLPQLTPRSLEFIETGATLARTVEYADLYRVRPLALRRPWPFDNGLWLMPFGLSSSREGRANADPVEPGEVLRLSSQEASSRVLDLRFVWRVESTPSSALKLFVHLIDERGQRVAQRDTAPQDNRADTRQWQRGDAFQDVHSLPLPASLPVGRYRVEVGIYRAETNQRLTTEGQSSLLIGYLVIN